MSADDKLTLVERLHAHSLIIQDSWGGPDGDELKDAWMDEAGDLRSEAASALEASEAKIAALTAKLRAPQPDEVKLMQEQLRRHSQHDAADMLAALTAENDTLREALAPFAKLATLIAPDDPKKTQIVGCATEELRRARAALRQEGKP